MSLTLVHVRQVVCWPWHLRGLGEEPVVGALCRTCRRDVALPKSMARDVPICLYCALDDGLVEAVETPLYPTDDPDTENPAPA